MSNESESSAVAAEQPATKPAKKAASASAAKSSKPKKKTTRRRKDPLVPILGVLVAGVIIAILAFVAGAMILGYFGTSRGPQKQEELLIAQTKSNWEQNKSTLDVWAPYIDALINAKQYTEAQQLIDEGLKKFEKTDTYDFYMMSSQAFLYYAKGEYEATIKQVTTTQERQMKAYKEMLKSDEKPNRAKSWGISERYDELNLVKAGAYEKLGKYDQMASALKDYLKRNKNESGVWYDLGRAYVKLNKKDDAKSAFDKALKYDPQNTTYQKAREQLGD